jgi:hypothetical protein
MTVMPSAPLGLPPIQNDLGMMGLPLEDQPWPPPRFNPVEFDYRVWDALPRLVDRRS